MVHLSLSFLGPFQAWTANGTAQTFRTLKERALLAYLAVENGRMHRREKLAGLFWPDRSDAIARNNLRQALYGVRQLVGEEGFNQIFTVTPDEVQLNQNDHLWLDLTAFEVHMQASQMHDHAQTGPCPYCLQHLRDAVEIYRGSFLEDVSLEKNSEFENWLVARREHYFSLQMLALEFLVSEYQKMGDGAQAVLYAERQVQLDNLKEPLYRRLMSLLANQGRSADALEQFEICQRKIKDGLGLDLDEKTVELAQQIRSGCFNPESGSNPARANNLPEYLTPFIGREMELAQIFQALEAPAVRLVTLLGPGGVGKTRLAIQSALLQWRSFSHGVFFVPLDSVLTADQLPDVIGRAIGLTPGPQQPMRATLLEYLRLKHVLLVLDNFEHLLEARDFLLEIMEAAPYVKLLVSSRERLHLQVEFLIELHGLPFQPLNHLAAAPIHGVEDRPRQPDAMQLLLERASRVRSGGTLNGKPVKMSTISGGVPVALESAQEMESAARLCQLVEGLPLGIELAASCSRDFTFAQIADELQRNLEFLQTSLRDIPERHRSLWASFEHSWDLLSESEREVFSRLSVFPGSFSAVAAHQVAGAALPWLMQLEDKSLIRRVTFGRYDLHPLIRQYAGSKLRQYSRRVEDQAGQQHATYFCSFIKEREQDLKGGRQAAALNEIETDLENVRAAWNWAVEHRAMELLDRAAGGMMVFCETRTYWREGADFFGRAVRSVQSAEVAPASRPILAYLMSVQGWFCCRLTLFEESEKLLLQSIHLQQVQEMSERRMFGHFALGFLYTWMGRYPEALLHLSTAQSIGDKTRDIWAIGWLRQLMAEIGFESGRSGYQDAPFLGTLKMFESIGDQRGSGRALNYLGSIALAQGRLEAARGYFEKLLTNIEPLGDVWGAAGGYGKLGQVAAASGDYEQAWRLQQHSLEMLQKTGDQRRTGLALSQLGETAAVLGRGEEADQFFHQALEIAVQTNSLPLAQDTLTRAAAILLQKDQPERALALLAAVFSEPASDQPMASRANTLLAQIKAGSLAAEQIEQSLNTADQPGIWEIVDRCLNSTFAF